MSTLLSDLVRRQTASSLLNVFSRTADKVAEEMAQDLLHEPEFREQLRALIRTAFAKALEELQQPQPDPPKSAVDQRMDDLRRRAGLE